MRDVADVATHLILSGEASCSVRRPYHLTGPDGLSMDAIAEHLSLAIGRTVNYTHRTSDEQRALLLSLGLPDMIVGLLVGIDVEAFASGASTEKTSTVEAVLGRPPPALFLVHNATTAAALAPFAGAALATPLGGYGPSHPRRPVQGSLPSPSPAEAVVCAFASTRMIDMATGFAVKGHELLRLPLL
ncbi:hypothetical protein [Streptomyces africanus]|uniref:hypothetical protein n=1 Tax=Streptomyces africanus TaxID=231024 RepID=UPI001FC97AB8|nr:hypothetical protein [Streptomyces africanus]